MGQENIKKNVQLKIPAGVETGSRLRLRGEGESGDHGGPNGDLYAFLHVEEHEYFTRSNDDIICRVPISFVQAALGATIEVPTLQDNEKIKIPKGTQTGKTFRLKGKGIPHVRGLGHGDQIIDIFVQTPTELSKKQEELLREFDRLSPSVN
jgi:molecular chaperone DnaJ